MIHCIVYRASSIMHHPSCATHPIAHRTPAMAPQKISWRPQAHFFGLLDRPPITKTEQTSKTTEDSLETSIAASPLLLLTWRLRAPSAHPSHPESDCFLSCTTKIKGGWRRRARNNSNLRSRLRSSLFVGWALWDAVRYSRLFRVLNCLTN